MGKLETGAHTKYKIRYHFVWIVKYRRELLSEKGRAEEFLKILREIAERYGYVIDTVGTDGDHVHVLCGAAAGVTKGIMGSRILGRRILCWDSRRRSDRREHQTIHRESRKRRKRDWEGKL